MLYTIVNFTTQRGENRHTDISNFATLIHTRREFFREILYNNIAIIAIEYSKMYSGDTFGDFFHTVE